MESENFKDCIRAFRTEQSGIRVALALDWAKKKYKLDRESHRRAETIRAELKSETGIEISKKATMGLALELGALGYLYKPTGDAVFGLKVKEE